LFFLPRAFLLVPCLLLRKRGHRRIRIFGQEPGFCRLSSLHSSLSPGSLRRFLLLLLHSPNFCQLKVASGVWPSKNRFLGTPAGRRCPYPFYAPIPGRRSKILWMRRSLKEKGFVVLPFSSLRLSPYGSFPSLFFFCSIRLARIAGMHGCLPCAVFSLLFHPLPLFWCCLEL